MSEQDFHIKIQKNIKELFFRDSCIPIENFTNFHQLEQNNKFKHFFNIAKNLSVTSDYERFKLGAMIVLQGKIIARGINSSKTHPVQKKLNKNREESDDFSTHPIHAEISTLNKVKHMNLKKAEMFIYHEGPNGNPKLARPCPACMEAIQKSGLKTIHYSTPHGFATEHIKENMPIVPKAKKR